MRMMTKTKSKITKGESEEKGYNMDQSDSLLRLIVSAKKSGME